MPVEGIPSTAPIVTPDSQAPAAPDVKSPSPADDPKLASRFAALTKREKSILEKDRGVKAREEALAKREAELNAKFNPYESLLNQALENPMPLLEKLNWDYNRLTEAKLKDFKPDPAQVAMTKTEQLEKQIQDMKAEKVKEAEEAKARKIEDAKTQYNQQEVEARRMLTEDIKSKADTYEFINAYEEFDLVYETMKQHFEDNKKIMNLDEACQLVEAHLEKEILGRAEKAKKFQAKYKLDPKAAETKAQTTTTPDGARAPVTITNKLASFGGQSLVSHATDNERIQRALAALNKSR